MCVNHHETEYSDNKSELIKKIKLWSDDLGFDGIGFSNTNLSDAESIYKMVRVEISWRNVFYGKTWFKADLKC